jgi:hypothetical protein
MDNYSGAPFFMIHNQDPKWAFYDAQLSDPVLPTDRLSLNWFCLAFKYAGAELELYRKQIFDNTRALLNRTPKRLLSDAALDYRVIPSESSADQAFFDIKITGPFHAIRAAALVAGTLHVKSLEGGHPIFNRPSIGFYHPNYILFLTEENTSSMRLTLGLDPSQVELFAKCLETIDLLNHSTMSTTSTGDSIPKAVQHGRSGVHSLFK